jgi:hypothetical protein
MKPLTCQFCQDQGIVELAGATSDGYSRGAAPCKWCDKGEALRRRLTTQKHHPLTDYSVHSLAATPQPGYHEMTKSEALAEWDACAHQWINQGAPQERRWAGDALQWQRCRCGKERGVVVASQKLAPTKKETP